MATATATATDSGTVVEVYTTTLGDELAAAASAGATVLTVKDAVDFDDAGGWLTIGTETVYYDTAVDDEDNDVGIVTLSTSLANAYAADERVTLDPPSFEKFALVMVGDFGEAVEAVVPHTLWDKISDGIRPDGEGEVVTLTLVGSTFEVTDVVGSEPVIDGSYLDPDVPLPPELAVSGPTVSLTATSQVLAVPAGGGATTPATSTVTGTALNTTISVWEYSVDGAAFSATVPAGVSRTGNVVTITGSAMTARTIAVRMADANGVADTLTVAKVSDGATGADAYTVLLTNEAHTFAGGTSAALAGSTTSQVLAYKGTVEQSATIGTITGQVTGLTTSIQNNGTTTAGFTVTVTTALTTTSGTLTVPITVGGVTFTKKFSWSLSLTGPAGPASDGNVPASSPAATVVSNVAGELQVSWPAVTNNDPVTYKVYVSTATPVSITAGNLLTQTPALSMVTTVTAAGAALTQGTRYYVRIVASDRDGDATSAGTEGSAVVKRRTDGVVPASSPAATVKSLAVGQLQVTWPEVSNADPVTYEVYLSTTTPVPINSGTLLTKVSALTALTTFDAAGVALAPNTRYYVRIRAADEDGPAASAGTEGSAVVLGFTDGLAPLGSPTPTVYGAFGMLAVRFTPLTITGGATRSATVNPDQVTYDVHLSTTSSVAGDATTLVGTNLPGSPLFIRSLPGGAALAPDTNYWVAIRAKDADGNGPLSTIVGPTQLAKATGSDIVLTVAMLIANGILADAIEAENLNGTIITGPTIRTSASGNRLELSNADQLKFYSGSGSEISPGILDAVSTGTQGYINLASPTFNTSATVPSSNLTLYSTPAAGGQSQALLRATQAVIQGYEVLINNTLGGTFLQFDGAASTIRLGSGHALKSSSGEFSVDAAGNGSIGTGSFADSVDQRVFSLAPTVTMTSGDVGTGAFRTSVDSRVSAVAPTVTMTTGSVGTSTFRDTVRSAVNGSYTEAWTTYTPTFTAATTNPTLANFTRTGRYIQRGKTVTFVIVITCNAASGFGSGTYSFGLPAAARAVDEVVVVGSQDAPNHAYVGRNNADTTTVVLFDANVAANMNSVNSGMASGTKVRISGTYEAA